jgi:hypothetical protein
MPKIGENSATITKFSRSRSLKSPRDQPNSSSSEGSKIVMPVAVMPFDRNSVNMQTKAMNQG